MKTVEDLAKSREQRAAVIEKFGSIPQSIMTHDKSDRAIDLMAEKRSYASRANDGGHKGKLASVFDVSGQSCRGSKAWSVSHHGDNQKNVRAGEGAALSRFPQNIGRSLLLLYTERGQTVADPFAGHNSRMELCWRSGRNYRGNDLSETFMDANRIIRDILLNEGKTDLFPGDFTASIELSQGDSRKLPWPDESADFTITSPPYHDIEWYGNEPEQLGRGTYEEFLGGLQLVVNENYRVLRPQSFCVWCINDFRKNGKFYSYHEDTAQLLRNAGFIQWDIAITDLGEPIRAAFAQQIVETKILPKRHEYCLIFRKP